MPNSQLPKMMTKHARGILGILGSAAEWRATGSLLGQTYKNVQKKGLRGLDSLSDMADPVRRLDPRSPASVRVNPTQRGDATLARGVRTSLGNTARALQNVFGEGIGAAPKNLVKEFGKQVRNDGYVELNHDRPFFGPRIKGFKNGNPTLSSATGQRPVIGETRRGSSIAERSMVGKGFNRLLIGNNPLVFGGATALQAAGDPNKSTGRKVFDTATTATLGVFSTPAAIAHTMWAGRRKKPNHNIKGEF